MLESQDLAHLFWDEKLGKLGKIRKAQGRNLDIRAKLGKFRGKIRKAKSETLKKVITYLKKNFHNHHLLFTLYGRNPGEHSFIKNSLNSQTLIIEKQR